MPQISLLCSAYNADRYIREMIASVLQQTHSDFELLIYDDCSTDMTLHIASSFADPRIKVKHGNVNRGQSYRLHQLMQEARGEFVGWVDADDILDKRALDYTSWVLENYPEYGLVYTDHFEINELSRVLNIGARSKIPYSREALLYNFMPFNLRLFRSELYDRIEPLDTRHLHGVSDYELCLKLSEITDFMHLPIPLYYYRLHASSLSQTGYQHQSEVVLQLLRDTLRRRGITDKNVVLRYDESDGKAVYEYISQ